MKKITLSILLAAAISQGYAQTQRRILYEEFTGENCGPCASTNPALNNLLHAAGNYNNKILAIKYQCNIPSAPGPNSLYGQNTAEVGTRQTYYSVPFAPYARFNGSTVLPGSSPGHAGYLTQTYINDSSGITAPFALTCSHTFTPNYDSVNLTVNITAAQNFTSSGALKLHVAMEEFEIHLLAPTGTNGEKDFEDVMRKMVPNATGTTLGSTWTSGQNQVVNLKAAIPSYIFDKSQLCFVAFLQSDGNKRVHQSAFSAPVKFADDAAMSNLTGVPTVSCNASLSSLVATIKNAGSSNLTSCIIYAKEDAAGTPVATNWSGNLAPNSTATVTLNPLPVTAGTHTLYVYTSMPNGNVDVNPNNDNIPISPTGKAYTIYSASSTIPAPITEGYQGTAFPPANWAVNDNNGDGVTWTRRTGVGGFGTSTAAARCYVYNSPSGQIDEMILPYMNLTGMTNAQMTFAVAYAQYQNENDRLEVQVSTNCGQNWTSVYNKAGTTLMTAPSTTVSFQPTATQWRTETVSLSSYAGQNAVMVKFKVTSAYGNNIFVDDINLNNPTGISEHSNISLVSIYPNPATDNANVTISLANSEVVTLTVYNNMGQIVSMESLGNLPAGDNLVTLNTASLSGGIYNVVVTSPAGRYSQKLTISK